MRDDRPGSNLKHRDDDRAALDIDRTAPLVRHFSPADLDVDDLAEAIRLLLEPERAPKHADDDLLSFPHRGTHVVEANAAH